MATSIPAFHVSDVSKVSGNGSVFIQSRQNAERSGTFSVFIDVQFNPAVAPYPTGKILIRSDLSETPVGSFQATSIDHINSHGKHNPTVFLTGRCDNEAPANVKGCRYWLLIANNKKFGQVGIHDVVSFAVHDNNGNLVAYGTGTLRDGDYNVTPK